MNLLEAKYIHFIGAGGIGVSALVKFFLARGVSVSCSDQKASEILEELESRGAQVVIGQERENIPSETQAVVYSSAIPAENPEWRFAKETNLPMFSYPEALGAIMEKYYGIAVSGTHGKTTTTSLLGKMLEAGGKDPLVVVGGKVPGWDGNLRLQNEPTHKEGLFVAEACEYRRNMLSLSPKMIVLTNIEEDHLDYYRDLNDINDAFGTFISNLPKDGVLIYNGDDSNTRQLINTVKKSGAFSYGIDEGADLSAKNVRAETRGSIPGEVFTLVWNKETFGEVFLSLPGRFNISNFLAAALSALTLGVSFEAIQKAALNFHGSWRRFELVGKYKERPVFSDYAHHPTAIRKTVEAMRETYPEKKILAVFQPHQRNRTKKLFEKFIPAFKSADGVIISKIYEVAGREENIAISGEDLAEAIKEDGTKNVFYAPDLKATEDLIKKQSDDYDIFLIMGAGNIHTVAMNLAKN